ncbi:hypothetical protein CB1_000778002 [Camelus ferus]|nr:hypothetical protein CB1_000778002 [Camelus ferus]
MTPGLRSAAPGVRCGHRDSRPGAVPGGLLLGRGPGCQRNPVVHFAQLPGVEGSSQGEAGGSARGDRWVSVGGGDGTAHGAVTLPVSQALIVALGSLSTDGWGWRQSIQGGRVHLLLNPVLIFRAVVSMYTTRVLSGGPPRCAQLFWPPDPRHLGSGGTLGSSPVLMWLVPSGPCISRWLPPQALRLQVAGPPGPGPVSPGGRPPQARCLQVAGPHCGCARLVIDVNGPMIFASCFMDPRLRRILSDRKEVA